MTAVQNGGLALFPFIVGQILQKCNGDPVTIPETPGDAPKYLDAHTYADCQDSLDNYKYTETFFVALAAFGFAVGLFLNFWDSKHNWRLNAKKPPPVEDDETKPLIN